jgi:hypothetical protein
MGFVAIGGRGRGRGVKRGLPSVLAIPRLGLLALAVTWQIQKPGGAGGGGSGAARAGPGAGRGGGARY